MFRFDWSDIATGELLDRLRAAAGSNAADDLLRPPVAAILKHCGGLPVAEHDWDDAHRTAVGARLMQEALGHAIAAGGHRPPLPGVSSSPSNGGGGPLTEALVPAGRVDLNSADAAALEPLPVIGPALAGRILAARRSGGPFADAADLADRVSGLGAAGAQRLSGLVTFADPGAETGPSPAADGLEPALTHYLSHHVPGGELVDGLERLATRTAAAPHPATRGDRMRPELAVDANVPPATEPAAAVELVEDSAYRPRLLALLGDAENRIDVAMFYMASGGGDHPNTAVVDALADARARGVQVRVVLDRDRPDDPYGSEIINSRAVSELSERGIAVRVDARDRLLHSKCVCIDERQLLIGSHNWTRASFETYRDASLVLHSPALASAWHRRFDTLWDASSDP